MQPSIYRLGDLYQGFLYPDEQQEIVELHPGTIGADYVLANKQYDYKCLDTIIDVVLKHIEKNNHLLPKDIEDSTVVHLRLGDVVGGFEWYEVSKRPLDLDYYKNTIPQQNTYIIGQPFFAKTSSPNYEESIRLSEAYKQSIVDGLNAKLFDGGHADIDLCCAVKCKCFVQGRGFFSSLIVEIRKRLNLQNIETVVALPHQEVLTLKKLKERVDWYMSIEDGIYGDLEVCIPNNKYTAVGEAPVTKVKAVGRGIDRDPNKFVIYPEIRMTEIL